MRTKIFFILLFFSLLNNASFAQQSAELDSKFLRLPRYGSKPNITAAISTPVPGMQVYNNSTNSIWYYNGSDWINQSEIKVPLLLDLNGTGLQSTITSIASGTSGQSAFFRTTNTTNDKSTVSIENNGLGWGVYAVNSNSSNIYPVIHALNGSSGTALSGHNSGTGSAAYFGSSSSAALAEPTLNVLTERNSNAAYFNLNYASSNSHGVRITSNGQASSLFSEALGIGMAGYFRILNASNNNISLKATTNGLGTAGEFSNTNVSASAPVVDIKNQGSGYGINIESQNAIFTEGFIKNKGFTQLGELSPKIKTVTFYTYIGAGSVETITHGLDINKILSINVFAFLHSTDPMVPDRGIPPSFKSLGDEYYYDYYFDDTKIHFIIPGTSAKVKNFFARVLISYTE
jgi:hypothetical protein